jgi:hypothetical protein
MPPSPYGNPSLADLVAMLYASQGQAAPIGGGGLQSTYGKGMSHPLGEAPQGQIVPNSPHRQPGETDETLGLPEGAPLPNAGRGGGFALPWNSPAPGAPTAAPPGAPAGAGAAPVGGATGGAAGGAGAAAGGAGAAGGTAAGAGGGLAGLLGNVNWGRLALVAAALLGGSQTGKPPAGGGTTTPGRRGGGGGGGGGSKVPLAPPVPYSGIQHNSSFVGYQPIQPFTTGGSPTNFVSGAGSSTPARPTPPPPPAAKPEGKRPPRSNSNPRPNRPGGPANGPQNRTPHTEPTAMSQEAMMQFLMSLIQADPSLLQGVGGQSQGGG